MSPQDSTPELRVDSNSAARQLDRILASHTFRQADRLKRFLSFIVKQTVDGHGDDLKEFSVGVEVFDRKPSFDPRFDPIVRVQARRLRAQLDRYYAEEAGPDEIIIEMPKGGYAAIFRAARPAEAVPPAPPRRSTTPLLISRNTVLALPFLDYSPEGEEKLFCAGLNEEIIHTLTNMKAVRLVGWSGIPANPGEWDLKNAAVRFNAGIIVSGSVRKSDSMIRITANLIDTMSGCYLWSMSIDRNPEDIFAVQEEVARTIAEKLEIEIAGELNRKDIRHPMQNLAAYNHYVLGRYHLNQRTEEGLRKAIDFFEKAVAEDVQYAQAYSGLADAYMLLGHYGGLSPAEAWTKGASNATWAVHCDPYSVEAHTSLAHLKATQEWDWLGAEQEFLRAISLDPRYPTAHHWYAVSFWAPVGKLEEACDEILLAQTLDPISPIISRDVARIYYYMGNYDAALEQCDKTIELDPHFPPAYALLGLVQQHRGELDESSAAFQRAIQLSPQSPSMQAAFGNALALSGKHSEAREILGKLSELATQRYVSPFDLALLHLAVGQNDEGFRWLDKAFEDRSFELISLKVDPRLNFVKSNPRFTSLLGKLGLP